MERYIFTREIDLLCAMKAIIHHRQNVKNVVHLNRKPYYIYLTKSIPIKWSDFRICMYGPIHYQKMICLSNISSISTFLACWRHYQTQFEHKTFSCVISVVWRSKCFCFLTRICRTYRFEGAHILFDTYNHTPNRHANQKK